ncbi:hypothetical protein [Listeria fleischmannii]|uniref:Uncharacterized protein n=1 Tax=Listeria fleischmannii FSL S10-1203 TaxID=1265822 RepID=W7DMD9_9LIST|nr:hypothetical protein [Listeria fleischmannii]EUJ48976.1 hypothetical protein MCOL2_16427 [Listeria fleischmannii FSL S10-1203]
MVDEIISMSTDKETLTYEDVNNLISRYSLEHDISTMSLNPRMQKILVIAESKIDNSNLSFKASLLVMWNKFPKYKNKISMTDILSAIFGLSGFLLSIFLLIHYTQNTVSMVLLSILIAYNGWVLTLSIKNISSKRLL